MGRRGPPPTPTKVLKLRGSPLADGRKDEPEPRKGKPSFPKWFDADAKRIWRSVTAELEHMGLLARADRNALMRYCHYMARWEVAAQEIQAGRVTDKVLAVYDNYAEKLLKLEVQFGLTPSARARLATEGKPKQSAKDKLRKKFG